MVLHAQLLNEPLTLSTVPLILPLVTIHKQLIVCNTRYTYSVHDVD